ncbi:uncharacterized mitochondrial protein AtMg00810-like [Arachis duranensis]|uniref:Uncharacterized mitochondrial protein AtMg00810-like n=1 Tax=Arachis duranensis TaxID=130453 RepID=A0A6P4BNW6_ARADU|nr:uncharacterized mitochondrial protein AtMg00810-like [Arachis duranensis]
MALDKAFSIKDIGDLKYFLGLKIARSNKGISVCQRKYVTGLLKDYGLSDAKPVSTFMEYTLKLSRSAAPLYDDISAYRRLVKRLVYLTTTRPDICYVVGKLSFTNADWASCPYIKRSISGYCFFLNDALVSWKSEKQLTVARSSSEAEYRAMAAGLCESVLYIAANSVFHERTKHIEVDCHVVRERAMLGLVKLLPISSKNQTADIFTKALAPGPF